MAMAGSISSMQVLAMTPLMVVKGAIRLKAALETTS